MRTLFEVALYFHFCAMAILRQCTEFKAVTGRNFLSGQMLVFFSQ